MPSALEITSLNSFPICTFEDQKLILYFSAYFDGTRPEVPAS